MLATIHDGVTEPTFNIVIEQESRIRHDTKNIHITLIFGTSKLSFSVSTKKTKGMPADGGQNPFHAIYRIDTISKTRFYTQPFLRRFHQTFAAYASFNIEYGRRYHTFEAITKDVNTIPLYQSLPLSCSEEKETCAFNFHRASTS